MEPIITTIVTRDIETSLDLVTSFFIARLSDAEKGQVALLISDCADEANALGLNAHAKLFRFAEILWGGAAIGTEEMADDCATKTLSLIAGYNEQKRVNGHRASISPEWQRLVASKGRPVVAVEAPTAPAAVEAPVTAAEAEVPAAVEAEVPAAAVEVPATAVAAEAAQAPEPVRRRPRKQAATTKHTRKKTA